MAKLAGGSAAAVTMAPQIYPRPEAEGEQDNMQIAELAAAAMTRLRHDMETYHPNKPALAYALAGETHHAIVQQWQQYPVEAQVALLKALLDEATSLLLELQAQNARLVPTNGFMYGLQDEAIRLETLSDIALEEISRIEETLALRKLEAESSLQ